ncbi:pr1-like protein [Oryza sativa Japonica Group]|uniref:Pr1-like protein n=1 Tax=Oryza sativa subsp. japonica TaxID=39947 RepID=Q942B5_ORYSJ|nr:pr1-like protein [Oryza sativa Japonica Group]
MNRVSTSWGFVYSRVNKPLGAPEGGYVDAAGGRRRARAPMVAGSGHRHGGAAAERGEEKGETRRRSTAHPRSTATTKKAAGAEEGGGAARVDGDGGAPAVSELDEGVDGDDDGAAKPEEATPGRETVPASGESRPKVVGDRGERGRRCELDSSEETARQRWKRVRCGEGLNRVGRGRGRPGKEGNRPGGPAAINGANEICGNKSARLNAREREEKMGRKGEGITGSGGIRGGGGARRGRGGGSGGRNEMTGGPHPSARVAGGPAR